MKEMIKIAKIGGHYLTVIKESERTQDFDSLGLLRHWDNRIVIQADAQFSKQWSAFIHEVIHELSRQGGLGLTESQVAALGEGFYQVLTDNKLCFDEWHTIEKTETASIPRL